MKKVKELTHKQLRPQCDLELSKFKTTNDLKTLGKPIGQSRALKALEFGLDINKPGYNLFAFGPPGVGKRSIILKVLQTKATKQSTPHDWCYVYNFKKPQHPIPIKLPPGQGDIFRADMNHFIKELKNIVSPVLEFNESTVKNLFTPLKEKYKAHGAITDYLNGVEHDVIHRAKNCTKQDKYINRYKVNVMVDHSAMEGAPVIYENNPTERNLFGILSEKFSDLQAGALHYANGGYLIIDMKKLKSKKYDAWERLKCILSSKKISIDPSTKRTKPVTLSPIPIPLNIKVILIGERSLYNNLCEEDHEFLSLFKVAIEFEESIFRNNKNCQLYTRLIATLIRRKKLRPFDRSAVIRVINQSSRLIEDATKLSLHLGNIMDLLYEADYWASIAKHKVVNVDDVQKAIDTELYRIDRPLQDALEEIKRKFVLIDTKGKITGQINALTIVHEGNFPYGRPSRITAIARIGRMGEIINIEHEIELSGNIHSKGVMILTGFLRNRYARQKPLSVTASIVFEQTYDSVEGDSASAAELCALLSALAHVPINQSLAVTGSINQYGTIQAIGFINEKIESFYDLCKTHGLTGKQGVIIPAVNVDNIMLKEEIVNAVKAKKFHIYPVSTIDEMMTILTGLPAGKRSKKGSFPKKSINGRVERCLQSYAEEIVDEHIDTSSDFTQ